MLKKIGMPENFEGTSVKFNNASFPSPFTSALEYNPPARGTWNIVHTGMLIPESHQIFVCARGCLRGVIMTAAEMNLMSRMSWVCVEESDMFDGMLEQRVIDGTADILNKISEKPKVILLFLSCIHYFAGCDEEMIIKELENQFPSIIFIDCYMDPTMRKSGITPDERMRMQLYKPLQNTQKDKKQINIIGNDRKTFCESEIIKLLRDAEYKVKDICECSSFEEYKELEKSEYNIVYLPAAKKSGETLEKRLNQKMIYAPLSYDGEEIKEQYKLICKELNISVPDFSLAEEIAKKEIISAKKLIGNTPVDIDYTAVPRPLSLARLLLENGFNVRRIYADGFVMEDENNFKIIKSRYPETEIFATLNAKMRFFKSADAPKVLAIGQKAAYFSNTEYFVNIVAGGGYFGFDGIVRLMRLMKTAFIAKKDTKKVISYKGLGCESCL